MPTVINEPTTIACVGTKPKSINEHIGRVNSGHEKLSIARMVSPEGWEEPGQTPEFEEYTLVLEGTLKVEYEGGILMVEAGQTIVTAPGEWVRYSTPLKGGAVYVAVCLPAFSPDSVHRDDDIKA